MTTRQVTLYECNLDGCHAKTVEPDGWISLYKGKLDKHGRERGKHAYKLHFCSHAHAVKWLSSSEGRR